MWTSGRSSHNIATINTFPTWLNNNFVITSKRRHFDVITSKWRRSDVITTSLLCNVFAGFTRSFWLPTAFNTWWHLTCWKVFKVYTLSKGVHWTLVLRCCVNSSPLSATYIGVAELGQLWFQYEIFKINQFSLTKWLLNLSSVISPPFCPGSS